MKKRIIILSTNGTGEKIVVRITPTSYAESRISISGIKIATDDTLYFIGDKITKLTLNQSVFDYKLPIDEKSDFLCLYRSKSFCALGGTAQVPTIKSVLNLVNRFEENQKAQNEIIFEDQTAQIEKTDNAECDDNTADHEQNTFVADKTKNISEIDDCKSDDCTVDDCSNGYQRLSRNEMTPNTDRTQLSSVEERVDTKQVEFADTIKPNDGATVKQKDSVKMQSGERRIDIDKDFHYDGENFYNAIKPQIDELFVRYPAESALNDIVPNSRWVRVEEESGYYVVGVLFDGTIASYICYGIPSVDGQKPPTELIDVSVWLPTQSGRGYWIIYQSAIDGKCIR